MPSPHPTRKRELRKRRWLVLKILTRSLNKSQLEARGAREAVTSKTDLKAVAEAYQPRTKKPNTISEM